MMIKIKTLLLYINIILMFILQINGLETSTQVYMDFNHEQLYSFFQDLEQIQRQLDSLKDNTSDV